ncbi:MAG: hypothetical protein QOH71_3604 [Blastocatellia bacterium]|jgi:hypothetical protein|nr:hypothetical protein [Blastocatellia bacterium]
MLILGRHLLWTGPDGTWWYDDAVTWITGALVLSWALWFLVRGYLRARGLMRRSRRTNYRLLKRTARIKRELSSQYLRPSFSANIHAVGIGRLAGGDYCIHVFLNDADDELWAGSGAATLPNSYRGVPVVPIEMPMAGFLSDAGFGSVVMAPKYPHGIRDPQEVIIGGISGAHTNLSGQSGTIGYFCTRKSKLPRRKEVHLLSNRHVFADLGKAKVDEADLIVQPSPGESASNRPIGTLVSFSALKFDNDINEPNHVDAAIAKLWAPLAHKPLIPLIGAVKGYVATKDVEIGEAVRKFGRTTGYTEGKIFSICLDISIRYARTGQSAFFQDQFLIEPALPQFTKFVSGGDSGSLLVDAEQHAIGLIFAGMSELPESLPVPSNTKAVAGIDPATDRPKRIESYGVANPISEVLDRLKIELI